MSEDFHLPTTPAPERPRTLEEDPLRVVLIDQSRDAEDEARDRADARLDQELGEGGRFKKFVNGIWKGNIAKEFYRQRYIQNELTTIQNADTVLINEAAGRRTQALTTTIDRFTSEHEELIHGTAGERREVQAADTQLTQGVKHLIGEFVHGRLNATTLREERTRLLNEFRDRQGPEAAGKGIATVDNLLDIAQAVAGTVEHGESLDNALARLEVITGEARNGARTEARYNKVDSVIDKLGKTKVGSLVNPGTLATVVAGAAAVARVGGQGIIGNVARAVVPGAVAGLWAGLRENKRTKDERAQHAREVAVGGEFAADDKRRVEMEKARYESVTALDLIHELQEVGSAERLETGNDALQAALDALAAVQARISLSDTKKIDLISFSSKADVGEERMMLDLARREARLSLEERLTAEARADLNIGPNAEVRGLIDQRAALMSRILIEEEGGLNEKDKVFAKLKARRVAKAAALGTGVGIVGGLLVQEVVANFDTSRFGLMDAIRGDAAVANSDGLVHQTTLESVFNGDETIIHTEASSTYANYETAPNGSIALSDDHELITNEDGTIDLKAPNGELAAEGLIVDEQGTLDQVSLDKLDAAGLVVEDKSSDEEIISRVTETVSTEQFLEDHSDEGTKVVRDFWYANDTPDIFDYNELGIHQGGSAETPGIVEGGYQYSVAGMQPAGSWEGGESVNWDQAAENGNLFVAISGTVDGQGNPFMIPIGPDGAINIPDDSPAAQFFSNENNTAVFNGAYMEVVQTAGVDADGTVHIRPLATEVGTMTTTEMTDIVETTSTIHHAEYTITSNGYDTVQENFTEMAPITPVASRRSLEALRQRNDEIRNGYAHGEFIGADREEFSPRIRNNPDAQLDLRQELGWYKDELSRREGAEYAAEIQSIVQSTPEFAAVRSDVLSSVITVPVGAAHESENIYQTLSLYAQQDAEQLAHNLVVLNTNWLDTDEQDSERMQKIQKTLAEIERAKNDFPDLRIASFTRQYSAEEVNTTGGVIGYVASDLFNVALLGLEQHSAANPSVDLQDVAIIRQDADMEGISRHYLRNLEKSFNSSEADLFNGIIRSGVNLQSRYPGIGIVTNFSQALNIARVQHNQPWTVGINTVIRASTLAAIGGLGKRGGYTGPGSDDVQVGQRVQVARRNNAEIDNEGYATTPLSASSGARKIVTQVPGLTVDSSALRLIPQYLIGRHFGAAWNGGVSGDSGFTAGPGGYKNREEFAKAVMDQHPKDIIDDDHLFKFININMTGELANHAPDHVSPEDKEIASSVIKKTLAVFFGSVPGAYTIHGEIGDKDVRFELTAAGKTFIKNRVQREVNGKFGSYGLRKMRQLYGVSSGSRQPVGAESPLVSPLG